MTVRPINRLPVLALALTGATLTGSVGRTSPRTDDRAVTRPSSRNGGDALAKMQAMRAWRIVEEVRLDEAAAARVLSVLTAYDEPQLALLDEQRDIVRELRTEATAAHPDDARLVRAIDRLAANRTRLRALRGERFAALRKVLSPVQQAQLLLLLPRLERELAHQIDADAGQRSAQ